MSVKFKICGSFTVLLTTIIQTGWCETQINVHERTCGAKALAAVFEAIDINAEQSTLRSALPRGGVDASLLELSKAAENHWRVATLGLRWRSNPPPGAPPAIIPVVNHEQERHFVAVLEWGKASALVQDDGLQEWIDYKRLRTAGWDGTSLHLSLDRSKFNLIKPRIFAGMSPVLPFVVCGIMLLAAGITMARTLLFQRLIWNNMASPQFGCRGEFQLERKVIDGE